MCEIRYVTSKITTPGEIKDTGKKTRIRRYAVLSNESHVVRREKQIDVVL